MERKLLLLISYILIACIAVTNVVKAQETSPLKVEPPTKQVAEPGLTFDIDVTITDVTELWSWAMSISWNPAVLNCTGYEEGPFMTDEVSTFFVGSPPDNVAGEIEEVTSTSMATSAPFSVSGSGSIIILTFLSIAEGTSNITIGGPDFMDEHYMPISVTVENGTVIVIPEFPASMVLPLFIITTITIAIIAKLMQSKRRRGYINAP